MSDGFNPNLPNYLQMVSDIKLRIASGALAPGERLESVRDMSKTYGVNPNTAQRALSELEREGLVYSERTSGRFITEDVVLIKAIREDLANSQVTQFLDQMASLGFTAEELLAIIERKLTKEGK